MRLSLLRCASIASGKNGHGVTTLPVSLKPKNIISRCNYAARYAPSTIPAPTMPPSSTARIKVIAFSGYRDE